MANKIQFINQGRVTTCGFGLFNSYAWTINFDPVIASGAVAVEVPIIVPQRYEIHNVRTQCLESNKYSLSLRSRASVTPPNIYEIFKLTDIDQVYDAEYTVSGGVVRIINQDIPQKALSYLVVSNNDTTGNDLETLFFEMIIGDM